MTVEKAKETISLWQEMVKNHVEDEKAWTTFCDGSSLRNPGPSGAAAILVLNNSKHQTYDKRFIGRDYTFENTATNNQAELKGFELALDLLEEQHQKEARGKWFVLSDSQYMQGLFERNHTARANAEQVTLLRNRIKYLTETHQVIIKMKWVKAHCGITFNEIVDKMALAAAKKTKNLPTAKLSRNLNSTKNIPLIRSKPNANNNHQPTLIEFSKIAPTEQSALGKINSALGKINSKRKRSFLDTTQTKR